jgi:hypothetical protein
MAINPAASGCNFMWPHVLSTGTESAHVRAALYQGTYEDGKVVPKIIAMMKPGLEYFGPGKNIQAYGAMYSRAAGMFYVNRLAE